METKTAGLRSRAGRPKILEEILGELRLLRSEINLLLPYEDIEGFAHPRRISDSYKKAIKRHPPSSV